jgi:hypothetical protein
MFECQWCRKQATRGAIVINATEDYSLLHVCDTCLDEVLEEITTARVTHQMNLCPICGETVHITGRTTDGRLIGSCKDAFTVEAWNENGEQ